MKITLKSLISLCLSVFLLISTVACNSPVEPSTGNDSTVGMIEEQTTAEITTEDLTSEESRTETTELDEFAALFSKALNVSNFDWSAGFTYVVMSPFWGLPKESSYFEEVAPRVYIGEPVWEKWKEHLAEDDLILCEIYFAGVVESFYEGYSGAVTGDFFAEFDYLTTSLTWAEFVEIFEEYRPILDANGVVYCTDENGLPSDNRHWVSPGQEKILYGASVACLLTKEQIRNLQIPEGDLYIVISAYHNYK